MLTFLSVEARDAYLVDPEHVAFADWVRARIEHVTVVDYWPASHDPERKDDVRSGAASTSAG